MQEVLGRERIAAPLMIVRGDGTLVNAAVALEYPVETVLSGPAASVVGASFLSGLRDFVVADMGGTTTDVAVVAEGRPVVRAEGAVIGGWRTMVQAIDVHTCGLGGDSGAFDRERRLTVGPRRVVPLSLFALQFPAIRTELARLAGAASLPAGAGHFAVRNPGLGLGRRSTASNSAFSTRSVPSRVASTAWRAPPPGSRPCGAWSIAGWRRSRALPPAMRCTSSGGSTAGAWKRRASVPRSRHRGAQRQRAARGG